MFVNFRRIHKCQCVQLLSTCLVICVVMICWEELDHHIVSHVRSYMYRYLVNNFDFVNSSFAIKPNHYIGKDISSSGDEGLLSHSYLINHPGKCRRGGWKDWRDILLLLFVKSSPENYKQRQAIRDTWGNESYIWFELGVNVRVVFALGVHKIVEQRNMVQCGLLQEDQTYGDLIQKDFVDTFHNLTTKLIMQFQWCHQFCPQARFLMSTDDDVFVHMPNLVKYLVWLLGSQSGAKDLWVGHVHKGAPPVRLKSSKYYVPYELYPWVSYPDYTAGSGYIVSADVASKIFQATQVLNPSIYIDDVFMGICAKAMGISPQEHAYFSGEGKAIYHPCIYGQIITSHGHRKDVRSLWHAATDPTVHNYSRGFLKNLYCRAVKIMLMCCPFYPKTYSCLSALS